MESPLRQRILQLLRAQPEGFATLSLVERLGTEPLAVANALHGLRRRGLVWSTAGTAPGSVWAAVPDPPPALASAAVRGAAEVERARVRSAAYRR